jgi:predicted ester cyclase
LSDTRSTVEAVYEGINAHDLDQVLSNFAAGARVGYGGMTISGEEALRGFLGGFLAAFPDLYHDVQKMIVSGEDAAVQIQFYGTQTGPLPTPTGDLPATGRRVDGYSCDVITVRNGKVISWTVYQDQLSFLQQLGVIPMPEAATA